MQFKGRANKERNENFYTFFKASYSKVELPEFILGCLEGRKNLPNCTFGDYFQVQLKFKNYKFCVSSRLYHLFKTMHTVFAMD